jgi:hypothetical protein
VRRLDKWIGAHLFVPLIIRLCQRSGLSQWRFHSYTYMLPSWLLLYGVERSSMVSIFVPIAVALFFTLMAARAPDREKPSLIGLRLFFVALELPHCIGHALYAAGVIDGGFGFLFIRWGVDLDTSCAFGLMALAAEYACTIKTIPPLESSAPSRRLQTAGSRP